MKGILFTIGFVLYLSTSFAQTPVNRSSAAVTAVDARLKTSLNFYLPVATDTTLNGGLDSLGAMLLVIKSGDTSLYLRIPRPGGNKWAKMLRSGDAAGGVLSFNTRTGNVTLLFADVVTALGYTPPNPNGTNLQYIAGDGSKVTFPTIPAQFNPIQGYGISITGSYPNKTFTADTAVLFPAVRATISGGGGGISSLNGLTGATQTFATGTAGTDFGISSVGTTHTFNVPIVSGTNTGKVTPSLFNTWNAKISNITGLVTAGSNVTITGSGTSGSPYVINSTGGGGGTDSAVNAAYGLIKTVSGTDRYLKVDTGLLTTRLWDQKGKDSLGALISAKQPTGNYITALTGDVAASGPGSAVATIQANAVTTTKINNNAVTYAKMQAMTANKLLGSGASGTAVAEITLGTGLSFSGTTLNATGGGGGTLAKTQYNDSTTNGTDTVSDVNNPGNDGYQNRNNAFNFEHKVEDALHQDSVFNIMAIGHSFVDGLFLETNWKQILGNKIPFSGPGFLTSDVTNYNFGGSVPLATAHWGKVLGEGLDLWSVNSTDTSTDIDFANSGTDIGYNQYDSLRIYYLIKTGGGTFQIKLLSTTLITINTSTGTPGTLGVAAIGGFDKNTANDFIIHQTNYNTTGVTLLGYNAILKNTNGIRVNRVGHSGAVTQDYLNADSTMQAQQLKEINPKVVYIILSINDRRFSVTLPQYHSNMHRIINRIKLAVPGVNIVLVAEEDYDQVIWGSSLLSAATWANETRKISIEDTCGYLDLNKVFGSFAQFKNNGVLHDGLHPSLSSQGVMANNMFDMIPTISNTPLYSPHEVYGFKQWTWDADFFNFKDHSGNLLAAIYSGTAPSFRLYNGGADTYRAGTILGPGYMVTGMNDANLLGVNPSYYGGAILFDGRFITAPIRFDIQSATPGTAGGVGDNLKWQFGSATEFPLVGGVFDYTDAIKVPVGSAAQRPTGAAGYFREVPDSANYAAGFEGWNEGRGRYERFAMKPYVDSIVATNSAVIPPNLGSAYRVYAPQTPGFKTLAKQYGILIDSATTGQLGVTLDSATVYTYVRSLVGGSDTLKLAFAGTGERPFWATNDTLHGKTIKGLGSVSVTSGTDSTINVQLTGFTSSRIPFSSSSSVLADDGNLRWVNASKTLIVGSISGTFSQNLYLVGNGATQALSNTAGTRNVITGGTYTDNSTAGSGTATYWSSEYINGATLAASNSNVTYTNAATLYVTAPTAGTNITITNPLALKASTGNISIDAGNLQTNSIRSNGSTPGIAAGTGAGTSPTISVAGSDMSGTISVTTGTLPTLSATIATVTYNVAYASQPRVILTPANSNAALLSGVTSVFVNDGSSSNSAFVLTAGTTALTAATTYVFYYHCIQ